MFEELKESILYRKEKMKEVNEQIKLLEDILKSSGFRTYNFGFLLVPRNYLLLEWNEEKSRLMCKYKNIYRPLIEHKLYVRELAFDHLEQFSKNIVDNYRSK